MGNVLSLQLARERAWQSASNPETTELDGRSASNERLLERLEAENAQLRRRVVELALQIQALRDDARAQTDRVVSQPVPYATACLDGRREAHFGVCRMQSNDCWAWRSRAEPLPRRGGSCCHANSVRGTGLSAALGPITRAMMNWVLLVFVVMFGRPRQVANKKLGNGSGWTSRLLRGRGWASEPGANNE